MGLAPGELEIVVAAPILPNTRDVELESTRKYLAFFLLAILALEILAALAAVLFFKGESGVASTMKEMLAVIFTPTIALVGAATGFYFGQARSTPGEG
jgi:hypothetical protein